jgi:hypothetical protein
MAITPDEARTIANAFLDAAKVVDKYQRDNCGKISHEEYESLNKSFNTLVTVSAKATTEAVGLAIDAMADPLTEIKNVIDNAKDQIKKAETIGMVIRFVAGLADLGAGIMAKDPNAIVTSITNLNALITG